MITAEAVVASALMLGASGRTPGMALMRVCMIRDEDDAQTPSLGAALGYTALAVLLQVTVVGLLASYAMVHEGRTWLSGPTRTRFVDACASMRRSRRVPVRLSAPSVRTWPPVVLRACMRGLTSGALPLRR